jgi:predicted NAD-dependent protein-ADP-ribosyltransferase YbiA (DUF1768 family)
MRLGCCAILAISIPLLLKIQAMSKRKTLADDQDKEQGGPEKKAKKEQTVLMFSDKSKDAKAGKGAKECLARKESYVELDKIKNWRKVLSAFYKPAKPIEFNGGQFATLEHLHHASKFWKTAPDFAKQFEVNSGSAFAHDPRRAKSAGGKKGEIKENKVVIFRRPKTVQADVDAPYKMRAQLLTAKFTQDAHAAKVLRATGSALLTHWVRFMKTVVVESDLMNVRATLVQT